jgi:AraC-like DNA-binding protein
MSRDALLEANRTARKRKEKADHDTRLLLAYAREHVTPRPYRLADLADAAGLSISGVRTGCSRADAGQAALASRADDHRHIQQAVTNLLAHKEPRTAPGPRITAA